MLCALTTALEPAAALAAAAVAAAASTVAAATATPPPGSCGAASSALAAAALAAAHAALGSHTLVHSHGRRLGGRKRGLSGSAPPPHEPGVPTLWRRSLRRFNGLVLGGD